MLKISYAGCPAISAQFTLEMCVAARNREKFTKTPILGFQSHSRSLMLTPLKNSLPVLVMISIVSVPIFNYFHARQTNSGKITSFRGVPVFSLCHPKEPLSLSGMKFGHKILETLGYHMVKTESLYLTWAWNGSWT